MLVMGEAMHVIEVGSMWKISVLSSQFYYEPKTILNNSFKKIGQNIWINTAQKQYINCEQTQVKMINIIYLGHTN